MQVAYVETDCSKCDEQGYQPLAWDPVEGMRPTRDGEPPLLLLKCPVCSGARRVREAVRVPDVPDSYELALCELESLREQVRLLEGRGLFVWPGMLARRDELAAVVELYELQEQITRLESEGCYVWPAMRLRREELHQAVFGRLLPAA